MGIKVRSMIREANAWFGPPAKRDCPASALYVWRVLRALERRTRRLEAQVETDREWASQDIDDLRTRVAALEVMHPENASASWVRDVELRLAERITALEAAAKVVKQRDFLAMAERMGEPPSSILACAEPPAEPAKVEGKTLGQIAFEADGDDGWSTLSTRCRNSWELFAKAAVAADRAVTRMKDGKTPGQRAYGALWSNRDPASWDSLTSERRSTWERIAAAARGEE